MSATITDSEPDLAPERVAVEVHRRGNRWMHWLNFPLLTIMIWSGLRIYWADLRDPFVLGVGDNEFFEFFPDWVNEPLGLNRKLARGMAFHFTFGWLFAINGLAFAAYVTKTKGWHNFVPSLAELRRIPAVLAHEIGVRKEAPPQGKYNAMQKITYGAILFMGLLVLLTGFAIYKPTQLAWLVSIFGGYESARTIHFMTTIGFLLFFVVHILQVVRAGFSTFWAMICGFQLVDKPQASRVIDEYDEDFEELETVVAGFGSEEVR